MDFFFSFFTGVYMENGIKVLLYRLYCKHIYLCTKIMYA